jgi:signal transduction histidine kinase
VDVLTRGLSDSGSTGLGLDIARRVAERTGGSIEVGSCVGGGARVRMNLHPAVPAT